NHLVFPDARRRRLGLATSECADHVAAWRANLVPLAVEFGVGNRNTRRRKPANDRNFAADVWSCSAETGKSRGGLANALTHLQLSSLFTFPVTSASSTGRRKNALVRVNVNDSHSNFPTNASRVFLSLFPDDYIYLKNISYDDFRPALRPGCHCRFLRCNTPKECR